MNLGQQYPMTGSAIGNPLLGQRETAQAPMGPATSAAGQVFQEPVQDVLPSSPQSRSKSQMEVRPENMTPELVEKINSKINE